MAPAVVSAVTAASKASSTGCGVGTLGSIATLSFYPTKILGTYGDGGMCVTNDPEWAERMACLRTHGMKPKYYHHLVGANFRIRREQAQIGIDTRRRSVVISGPDVSVAAHAIGIAADQ